MSASPFTEAALAPLSLADGRRTARTMRDVQRLFNRHGATEVFVRVATLKNTKSGDAEYGSSHAIERARLARQLDMPLNPELGLWAIYDNVRRQPAVLRGIQLPIRPHGDRPSPGTPPRPAIPRRPTASSAICATW